MRKINNYTIKKETFRDMINNKRFNPCLEITFRDRAGIHTHKLSAGYSDDIYVYRENGETFVLTQNSRLGYVGLEVFNGNEKIGDLFFEHHRVIENLGKDDLAPFTMIKRLKDYVNP